MVKCMLTGKWFSYTFGENSSGLAFTANETPASDSFWPERQVLIMFSLIYCTHVHENVSKTLSAYYPISITFA